MKRSIKLRLERKQKARFEVLYKHFSKGNLAPREVWDAWCLNSGNDNFNTPEILIVDGQVYYEHIEKSDPSILDCDLIYLSDRFNSPQRVNAIARIYYMLGKF